MVNIAKRISNLVMRRINTLADYTKLPVAKLRSDLKTAISSDPLAAFEFATQEAKKDWEDTNFKSNLKKIANFIKKEYPITLAIRNFKTGERIKNVDTGEIFIVGKDFGTMRSLVSESTKVEQKFGSFNDNLFRKIGETE